MGLLVKKYEPEKESQAYYQSEEENQNQERILHDEDEDKIEKSSSNFSSVSDMSTQKNNFVHIKGFQAPKTSIIDICKVRR